MTTAQPDLLRLAIRLNHSPNCQTPQVIQFRGTRDDLGLRCLTCNARWFPPARLIESTPGSEPTYDVDRKRDEWARPGAFVIPGAPTVRQSGSGWPTHKARARRQRR